MFDWQFIFVAVIVGCAALYVGKHLFRALRSFRADRGGAPCASGCGKCGDEGDAVFPPTRPVAIKRSRGQGA